MKATAEQALAQRNSSGQEELEQEEARLTQEKSTQKEDGTLLRLTKNKEPDLCNRSQALEKEQIQSKVFKSRKCSTC